MDLLQRSQDDDTQYMTLNGLLYSIYTLCPAAPVYPRLVLPAKFQDQVIMRAQKEIGHMSMAKALDRARKAHVWPEMKAHIATKLKLCTTCQARRRDVPRVAMGEMPNANNPNPNNIHGSDWPTNYVTHWE